MMSELNLQSLKWLSVQVLKRLSVFGLLGFIIASISGLFYFFKILPIQMQVEVTESNAKNTPTQIFESIKPAQLPVKNTVDEVNRFYGSFSTPADLPQYLSRIFQAATKQKLLLNQGDYKFTKVKLTNAQNNSNVQEPLSRYEMVLPITGEYVQIRQFIVQILFENPSLALANIQITRENTMSKTVEARLELVLFLKDSA